MSNSLPADRNHRAIVHAASRSPAVASLSVKLNQPVSRVRRPFVFLLMGRQTPVILSSYSRAVPA